MAFNQPCLVSGLRRVQNGADSSLLSGIGPEHHPFHCWSFQDPFSGRLKVTILAKVAILGDSEPTSILEPWNHPRDSPDQNTSSWRLEGGIPDKR